MLLSASTQLQSLDRGIVPILGDGSYLFRALSKLTCGSQEWHAFMRQTLVEFISLNRVSVILYRRYHRSLIEDETWHDMTRGGALMSCKQRHPYLRSQFMFTHKKMAVVTTTGRYWHAWKIFLNPLKSLEVLITMRSAVLWVIIITLGDGLRPTEAPYSKTQLLRDLVPSIWIVPLTTSFLHHTFAFVLFGVVRKTHNIMESVDSISRDGLDMPHMQYIIKKH